MAELTNDQLLEAIPKIFQEQAITPTQELQISTWHVLPWQKMLIPGIQLRGGKRVPVRLKIRVPGNINPKERFAAHEMVAREINELLFEAGLPAQRTLALNFDKSPEWIIREDLVGEPSGTYSFSSDISSDVLAQFISRLRRVLDRISPQIQSNLISGYDWPGKWRQEFIERRAAVVKHCGQDTAIKIEQVLNRPATAGVTNGLIHSDLAPANILRGPKGLFVIDWNEATNGPRAIDWMTIWSFAFDRPELRKALIEQMLDECKTEKQLEETRLVAVMLAARLLASFAEWHDYYLNNPKEDRLLATEAVSALPQVLANWHTLDNTLYTKRDTLGKSLTSDYS